MTSRESMHMGESICMFVYVCMYMYMYVYMYMYSSIVYIYVCVYVFIDIASHTKKFFIRFAVIYSISLDFSFFFALL